MCKHVLHARVTHSPGGGEEEEEERRERTILFSCSCAKKTYRDFLLSGRREEKRCDFFSLLLPANKIDRIQNVATKNPFPGKEKKKKKRANANTYIYKHTYTHRHIKSIKILWNLYQLREV